MRFPAHTSESILFSDEQCRRRRTQRYVQGRPENATESNRVEYASEGDKSISSAEEGYRRPRTLTLILFHRHSAHL